MKNLILLHGIGDSPESFWLPYVAKHAAEKRYEVWVPQLPQAEDPDLTVQRPFLMDSGKISPETTMIGHSSACGLILSVLQHIDFAIEKAVLVSGFASPLPVEGAPTKIFEDSWDWEKIRMNCRDFYIINSDNDPWGCDHTKGEEIYNNVGGTQIIRHGEGHMGSGFYHQPYKEFPLLVNLL